MTGTLPDVLTSTEVAAWLQCSDEHVRRMAAAGDIPGVRIGKLWRFSRPALERWIEQGSAA